MKEQKAWPTWRWLIMEAFALIMVMGGIAYGLCNSGAGRYFQLFIVLIASGALIHTFRRWLADGEREMWAQTGNVSGEFQWLRRVRRVTWIAWLGLAGVAWVSVSKPLWRNLLGASIESKSSGLTPEIYLAVLGVVVTAVTAFYLVILHRTTDKAEETLDKLGTYHDVLERLKQRAKDDQHLIELLNRQGIALRNEILLPVLAYLAMKNPGDSPLLQPYQKTLQVETALFRVGIAEDLPEFRRLLDEASAFQQVISKYPDNFAAHFAQMGRRLDHLAEEYGADADRQEIQKMRRELNRLQTM